MQMEMLACDKTVSFPIGTGLMTVFLCRLVTFEVVRLQHLIGCVVVEIAIEGRFYLSIRTSIYKSS
jgi:hypothetical protein